MLVVTIVRIGLWFYLSNIASSSTDTKYHLGLAIIHTLYLILPICISFQMKIKMGHVPQGKITYLTKQNKSGLGDLARPRPPREHSSWTSPKGNYKLYPEQWVLSRNINGQNILTLFCQWTQNHRNITSWWRSSSLLAANGHALQWPWPVYEDANIHDG